MKTSLYSLIKINGMFQYPGDEHRYNDKNECLSSVSVLVTYDFYTPSSFHLSIKQRQKRRSSSILLFVIPEHGLQWDRNELLIVLEHRHLDSASFERCAPFLPIAMRWTSFDCVVSFVSRLEWDHRHPTTNQPRVDQKTSCSVPYRTGLNATARKRICEVDCHCVASRSSPFLVTYGERENTWGMLMHNSCESKSMW